MEWHDNLCQIILQGTVKGEGKRRRQRKSRLDNMKGWTDITMPGRLRATNNRSSWRRPFVSSAASPSTPTIELFKGLIMMLISIYIMTATRFRVHMSVRAASQCLLQMPVDAHFSLIHTVIIFNISYTIQNSGTIFYLI